MKNNIIQNNIIQLNDSELDIILNLINTITASPSEDPDMFCKQSKHASLQLPLRIQILLQYFALHGSITGFLLIRGIPMHKDLLPTTPDNNIYKIGEQTILAKIQSLMIHCMGEMVAYEAEGYGRLFQDVVPIKSMEKNQTSVGSNIELEIHTEQAFSKLRPEIISLACIRGDNNAFTHILHVDKIIRNIKLQYIHLLREPCWKIGVDMSFTSNTNYEFIEGTLRGPIPILTGTSKDPLLTFDQDLMKGTTPESETVIQDIVDIYYKHRVSYSLQSGEIIIIDNQRAVHGRSPFYPKYDGYDRFLVRCFATLDYEKSRYARLDGGRMISAIFS